MLVYPTMMDETTKPLPFRTGRGDRGIPLFLSLLLLVSVPLWWWAAGPAFPGPAAGASALALGAALVGLARWRSALGSVSWEPDPDRLVFRRGRKVRTLFLADLTGVRVRPASVRTDLTAGLRKFRISHRLVRCEALLDRIRSSRPDLFPGPGETLRLRASAVEGLFTLALALASALAAGAVWSWSLPVAGVFVLGAVLALGRVLFLPRAFTVGAGSLRVDRILGRRTWGRPRDLVHETHSAGGAVFYRIRLAYGRRTLVLDEGHLTDPLRPWAGWVAGQLGPPPAP